MSLVWLSRDLDSIVNNREEKAVIDWLDNKNDKELMIMSDYQQHTWTIAGGMFGKMNNNNNNSISSFIVNYSDKNSNDVNKFANDCEIAEEGLYNDTNYIQYYRAGKKLENSIPFPDLSTINCNFIGNISPITKYYTDLQLEKYYPFLSNKSDIDNNDKFLYNPWKCFFKNSKPLCSVIWKGDDFVMTVDPKKEKGVGTWKTLNGDGKKLLKLNTHVNILWEGKTYLEAYMPNKETISIKHGERWYNFVRYNDNLLANNFIDLQLNNISKNVSKNISNYKKRLFNIDLHTSVIEDVVDIFKNLDKTINIEQWSMSGHHWVFNKPKYNLKYINSTSWCNIDMDIIDKFCNEYNNELVKYDGFVVTHSPIFCLIYERYKKPIFLVNSCRYVLPYCWNRNDNMLNILNIKLKEMVDNKQLFIVSNNIGDRDF
jgi:hypothetical protein